MGVQRYMDYKTRVCGNDLVPLMINYVTPDNSCIVWGENCGERTTCLLYDNHRMRTTISSFVGVFVIISTIFDIIAWFYCKDLQIFDEEPRDQTGKISYLKGL